MFVCMYVCSFSYVGKRVGGWVVDDGHPLILSLAEERRARPMRPKRSASLNRSSLSLHSLAAEALHGTNRPPHRSGTACRGGPGLQAFCKCIRHSADAESDWDDAALIGCN